jgi:hypothetical protein
MPEEARRSLFLLNDLCDLLLAARKFIHPVFVTTTYLFSHG